MGGFRVTGALDSGNSVVEAPGVGGPASVASSAGVWSDGEFFSDLEASVD